MNTIMLLLGWMCFGLVAGVVARLLHPGPDPMGIFGTILLGVMGSFLGGGIAFLFGYGESIAQPSNWIMSILGAVILLSIGVFATRSPTINR